MSEQKQSVSVLNLLGEIFAPLVQGAVLAGLCAGFASLLAQLYPDYASSKVLSSLYSILNLINASFQTYITAWVGYSAASKLGATPILGGMLGLITILPQVNDLSKVLGLYNSADPLNSVLCDGRGGIVAVFLGVWLLAKIERALCRRIQGSMQPIIVPLLTMMVTLCGYLLVIMPAAGYVSTGLCWLIETFCMSPSMIVRVIAGALSATLFLPLVAMGMHLGLSAIYTLQLEQTGVISLYPALAMAGAGQVGAAIAIYLLAKDNAYLRSVIKSSVPPGICGIGNPLIYGVTLPLGKPFFTAGLGAMFGGAYVTLMQVASTTWGPSGILAMFIVCTPDGMVPGMIHYSIGLLMSTVMGFLITRLVVKKTDIDGKIQEP